MVLTLEPGLGLGDFSEFNKVCGLFLTNLRFRPAVSATVEKAPAGFKDFIKHLILDFSCLEIFGLLFSNEGIKSVSPFLLRGFAVPVKKL